MKKDAKKGTTQLQSRSGLEHKTGYREGITYDPFHFAIVSPEPPDDLKLTIEVIGEDNKPKTYTFGKKDVLGPYDRHEPGVGWEQTFQWGQQKHAAARVQRHVRRFLAGDANKEIFCQHTMGQEVPIVVDGRHSTLAERLSNLIKIRVGKAPRNVGFTRRSLSEAAAATAARVRNERYGRDKDAEIRQNVYEIEVNGWTLEQAAEEFGKSESTIRAWINRVKEPSEGAPDPRKRARKAPTKATVKAAFERARKSRSDDGGHIAMVLEWKLTGKLPSDAPAWLRNILEG